MDDLTVLIVSTEPVIGALLALYVEVHQQRGVVAEESESPAEAVARCGAHVILVDVEHPDGFTPEFIAQQRAAGRRVFAFSPRLLPRDVQQRAEQLQVAFIAMPLDARRFREALEDARHAAHARAAPSARATEPDARA